MRKTVMFAKVQTHNSAKDNAISSRRSPQTATQNLHTLTQQTHPAIIIQRAMRYPGSLNPHDVLQLQRTIGNQAVLRLLRLLRANTEELEAGSAITASTPTAHDFSQIPLHPKASPKIPPEPRVNAPRDTYEQEADRIADQAMRTSESKLQRACDCGGECPRCKEEEGAHEQLQTKRAHANGAGEISAPPIVNEVLRSPGQPLGAATTAFFEPRFRHDFSQVRVHTDTRAAESARGLNARAFTRGSNIVFGAGLYEPETSRGRRLIAHELIHVVQQNQMVGQYIQRQEDKEKDLQFKRVPPGPGAHTDAEYKEWRRLHPDSTLDLIGLWLPKSFYARYTPEWFSSRGYFYSGSEYGGSYGAYSEVWLSNEGKGKRFKVFRDVTSKKSPKSDAEVKDHCDETEALDEARTYAEDYALDKAALISRAEELKALAARTISSSDEYIELYGQFEEAIESFKGKYNFIINSRFLELWECVASQDGVGKMGQYYDALNDFLDFDPYGDVVPGVPEEPIDFSGGP